ncbi:MAG: hypothetical protein JWP10_1168 [Nocardioidaceae bacterium]|nr:hypothetical protein [Nocardioidaceae bacterium]
MSETAGDDYTSVLRTFANYCNAADEKDLDLLHDVFTPDAIWALSDGIEMHGIGEMQAMIDRAVTTPRLTFHSISNVALTLDGDEGTATSNWILHGRTAVDVPWSVVSVGTYRDKLKKVGDRWLIADRRLDKWV